MEERQKGIPVGGFDPDWNPPAPMPVLERAKSVVSKKLMDLREAEALAIESAPCPASQEVVSRSLKNADIAKKSFLKKLFFEKISGWFLGWRTPRTHDRRSNGPPV
jgi:hypothetical protein